MHPVSTVAWTPDDLAGFPVRAFGACLVVPGSFPSGSRRILRRQGYRDRVDELADSGGLAGDPAALRARLAADGYVFLRGLLPAEQVRAAGELVAAKLRAGGWTAAGSPGPGRGGPREALADPAYRAAVMSLAFNALPYLAPLRGTVRRILGAQAFSYPVKVLRAVGLEVPAQRPRGRYIHCDYMGSGVQDMLTTWIPLAEVPAALGGLAVRPGGHRDRPRRPRPLAGTEPGWASTDYRPGDVIIFHCLTPHAALPNTGHQLRLSADFRWQQSGHPAPTEMILGPAGRRPELFSRLLGREPWWEPVPAGLALRPRAELAAHPPRPSWLFTADPAWQRWRPLPGPVH
jgi:hypothetical protein